MCFHLCAHLRNAAQSRDNCHAVSAVVERRSKNCANNLNVFVLARGFREKNLARTCKLHGLRSGAIPKIEFRNVVGILVIALNCEPHVFIGARLCIKGERVVVIAGHLEVPCQVERLIVEGIAQLGMFWSSGMI